MMSAALLQRPFAGRVAIPGERATDIRRADRPVVAKRELHPERLVEVVDVAHPEIDQRRGAQIDDDEIGLASGRYRADLAVEVERRRRALCREPPGARWRQRMALQMRDVARRLHRAQHREAGAGTEIRRERD